MIVYVPEFTHTHLHVNTTILKDNSKRGQPGAPKKKRILHGQMPDKVRQASGRTVGRRKGVCRQDLLHHLQVSVQNEKSEPLVPRFKSVTTEHGSSRGQEAGPSAAERRLLTLARFSCPSWQLQKLPEMPPTPKKPKLLRKINPTSSRNITMSFYNSSSNIKPSKWKTIYSSALD